MSNKTLGFIVVAFVLVLLAAPAIYTAKGYGLFKEAPAPELVLPENEKQCVESTEYMRANHMNLLLNERDNAVREGVRTVSHSLSNCKTCHEKREEFCDRCHEYMGIQPECFDCHKLP